MLLQSFLSEFKIENIGIEFGHELRQITIAKMSLRFGNDDFGRRKPLNFAQCIFIVDFRRRKISRRDVSISNSGTNSVAGKCTKIIVRFAV